MPYRSGRIGIHNTCFASAITNNSNNISLGQILVTQKELDKWSALLSERAQTSVTYSINKVKRQIESLLYNKIVIIFT